MKSYDNPAERLFQLLRAGKEIRGDENCRRAWGTLLDTQDNSELISRLGKAMALPNAALEAIRRNFPEQVSSCGHWVSQVNNAFIAQNLNGPWQTFINQVDTHSMSLLSLAANLLHERAKTKTIDADELAKARGTILSLCQDISASEEIEETVKQSLLDYLRKIIVAIDEYKITGSLPIIEAVETTLGHTFMDDKYRRFLRDTELGKRVQDCISVAANLVKLAHDLPLLSVALTHLLNQ